MGDHEDRPTTNFIQEDEEEEEEVDPQERAGSVLRSYECIFCKRGFTTAQALGGHMNIHRKDRAKSTTSSRPNYNSLSSNNYSNNNSQDQDQDQTSFYAANPSRFYHPIFASFPAQSYSNSTSPSYPPYHHPHHQEGNNMNRPYISPSTSSSTTTRAINYHENINHDQQDDVDGSSPSREEKMMMMSSSLHDQNGWSFGEDKEYSRGRIRGGDKEDGLDLELRLGQI